ncbi:ubiquitin-protein transferase [Aureococcus anophagefferens]|nr:ubiquitin-protein transferase [Aureococcus anophagefferens]
MSAAEWAAVERTAEARDDFAQGCPICLEPFAAADHGPNPAVLLSCSHTFHRRCLASAERCIGVAERCCPICRKASYEAKITGVAADAARRRAASTLQRGFRTRLAAGRYRARQIAVYGAGRGDGARRRRFQEREVLALGDRVTRDVDARADPPCARAGEAACAICMGPLAERERVLLSCSHVFHARCVAALERFNLEAAHLCPCCRAPYASRDYDGASSDDDDDDDDALPEVAGLDRALLGELDAADARRAALWDALRFRAETSWPVKSLVHEQFSDGFPALARILASPGGQPDAEGFFHYWFGVCDFDTQQQCEQAAATLRSLCAEMAKAPEAMARLRPTLEDHMRYWQRSPAAAAVAQLGNPPPPSQPNQYYARSPDSIKKGRWTDDEHQQFMDLMAVHGKSWSKIAAHMVNRSEPQVRSHAQKHFAKERKEQEEAAAALAGEQPADDGSAPPKKARLKNAAGAVAPTDGGGAILGLAQLGSAQAFQAPAPQAPAPPAFAASSEADADRAVAPGARRAADGGYGV